jgi:molybdenum cofactor biosynthesis protein B
MSKQNATTEFKPLDIAILTISDSRDENSDTSGRALVDGLQTAGHLLSEKLIVPDDIYIIRRELSRWIVDREVQVVITNGGTGLTGRDGTPEAVEPLLDRTIE